MPWSDELKEAVTQRVHDNSAALDGIRQTELGLSDQNPDLWKGIDSFSEDAADSHESFRNAVRLKSGGPLMQYEGRDSDGNVLCYWIQNKKLFFGSFREEDVVYLEQNEDLDN